MDPVLARLLWAALLGMAVGAVLGVLVAAMGKRRRHVRAAQRHAMLAEFRYLLSEDLEQAVEEITRRVAADGPGGVETWFALGNLLRRKGDHLRAIRLHEDLIANQRLHPSVRRAAAYELALDFRRAGMHGRATETLERLLEAEPGHREALRELRELAEEQGDWERAVAAEERRIALGATGGEVLGHLHAAHARALLAAGRRDEARTAAERALAADPASADARLASAEVLAAAGDENAAREALALALDRLPDLAAIDPLPAIPDPVGFFAARLERHPDHPWLRLSLARHLRRAGEATRAAETLRDLLRLHPQLAEARQELAEALLEGPGATDGALRAELGALLAGLGAPARPFACARCAVDLATFTFRCPRCFSWDTVSASPQALVRPGEIGPDRRTGS